MATLTSLQHRNGMIYRDQDDSSSGEYPDPPVRLPPAPVSLTPNNSVAQPRCSSRVAGGSVGSCDGTYSSSEEESYHSDCDDFAEYWDPYCEASS
jgi:hypothetical protein